MKETQMQGVSQSPSKNVSCEKIEKVRTTLDEIHGSLLDSNTDIQKAMQILTHQLNTLRANGSAETWKNIVKLARCHPLLSVLHGCPFTYHSYSKPRGYPGDAELLDYIYHDQLGLQSLKLSQRQAALLERNVNSKACSAVRQRRNYLRDILEESIAEYHRPSILAVACGHLREASLSPAVMKSQFEKFVAYDQDQQSLKVVEKQYAETGITCHHDSVSALLRDDSAIGDYDLIYAAGLYDYLTDRFASRLAERLFSMLKPQGRLVIANFTTDNPDAGYMECYMDWHLIHRAPEELNKVVNSIPVSQVAKRHTYCLSCPEIVYLELRKCS